MYFKGTLIAFELNIILRFKIIIHVFQSFKIIIHLFQKDFIYILMVMIIIHLFQKDINCINEILFKCLRS